MDGEGFLIFVNSISINETFESIGNNPLIMTVLSY